MTGNTVQQMLLDINRDFTRIDLPDDAVKLVRPQSGLLKSLQVNAMPLIKVCPPQVKTDIFYNVLDEVVDIVLKHKPDLEGDINKILKALPADAGARELFVKQVFTPGTNPLDSYKEVVPPETFGSILSHVLKPFMKLYAQKVSAFYDPEHWLKGSCPVCGGLPTLAVLEKEEGKRYLFCGFCEVNWRFQRLGCPYCSSNESKFFTVEGTDQYRVYYCDSCHGYIKTVNGSMFYSDNLDLFWEDINTVHLDLLAMQEGYFKQPAEITEK